MSSESFVTACLSGKALLSDVDDWIDAWHESYSDLSLDAFLGFTPEEGALFAEKPESLRFIVASRRHEKPVQEILASRDDFALAARAADSEKASAVLRWLRKTGRI